MGLSYLSGGWLGTNAIDDVDGAVPPELLRQLRTVEGSFIRMFDAVFRACMRSMSDTLRVSLVPASRAVPSRADVTFLLAPDATELAGESLGIQVSGLPEHLEITRSAFASEMERLGLREPEKDWEGNLVARPSKDPLDLVNRLLGDYLFSSSGYFVSAGIHELTLMGSSDPDGIGVSSEVVSRKFLVSLELSDSSGRRFNFDEVGSGLGYVLPVLLAVAASDVVFLQQPELHLHPALQAELGDALIVALGDADYGGPGSSGCRQIIAETHSGANGQ